MIPPLRSLLFVPGNNPSMVQNCGVYGADAVILDLEDAVAPAQKIAARFLVAEALSRLEFSPSVVVVRVNPLDCGGEDDLELVVPQGPAAILLPKAQGPGDVLQASKAIARCEPAPGSVGLIALLETPLGVLQSLAVAAADARLAALALGAEDYTAALGVARTQQGPEIAFARAMVANAAQAAGIQSFDTPYTGIGDGEGLFADTKAAMAAGFKGKLCIHPLQIDTVHQAFTPDAPEITWAAQVISAFESAQAAGQGAVAVNGKMVDAPIVRKAQRILDLARRAGLPTEVIPCETP